MATNRIVIGISNPALQDSQRTALSSDVASGGTTLNVLSTSGFNSISAETDYYYLVVGLYGSEGTEIVLASAKTDSTFTVSALKFDHSASDQVTVIPYNQIKIYGSATSLGSKTLIDTIDIDPTDQSTSYTYTGTGFSYFTTTFYRSATTAEESDYSDETSSGTFSFTSAKKIIEAGLKKAMTKVDENTNGSLSWNNLIDLCNEGLNEIITRKKQWSFLHKIDTSISTVVGTEYISQPTDVSIIDFIKLGTRKLKYATRQRYNQLKEFGLSQGQTEYWSFKNGKIYLLPTPQAVETVTFEYYAMPATITGLTQEINKEFATILIYYIAAHAAYIRGNEKRGDKMYLYYNQILAQQVEDMTGYEQTGEAESLEATSIYGPDNDDALFY